MKKKTRKISRSVVCFVENKPRSSLAHHTRAVWWISLVEGDSCAVGRRHVPRWPKSGNYKRVVYIVRATRIIRTSPNVNLGVFGIYLGIEGTYIPEPREFTHPILILYVFLYLSSIHCIVCALAIIVIIVCIPCCSFLVGGPALLSPYCACGRCLLLSIYLPIENYHNSTRNVICK